MKIDMAVRLALEQNKCIADKEFPAVKMKPIKGMPFVIMMSDGSRPCNNWNPTAEDLMRDCWIVVD